MPGPTDADAVTIDDDGLTPFFVPFTAEAVVQDDPEPLAPVANFSATRGAADRAPASHPAPNATRGADPPITAMHPSLRPPRPHTLQRTGTPIAHTRIRRPTIGRSRERRPGSCRAGGSRPVASRSAGGGSSGADPDDPEPARGRQELELTGGRS